MARPRKDTSALQGAYTKDAMKQRLESENKLKGRSDNLIAPEIVRIDEVALQKFEQLVNELSEVGVLANGDIDLLGGYCTAYSAYVRSTKMLLMQNMVEEQENKLGAITKVQNPYIKIQQSYLDKMIKIASLFGLSPADRTRIAHVNPSDKNEKSDPLIELLSGLKK